MKTIASMQSTPVEKHPIRQMDHYQQRYMPSQHSQRKGVQDLIQVKLVYNLVISSCTPQLILISGLKILINYSIKIPSPTDSEAYMQTTEPAQQMG